MEKRIQKILAETGIASRRKSEELILEGRVTVNGKIAVLGMKADPARDYIKVDGKLILRPEPKVYLAFNKPRGVVTSLSDPEGRPTVKDYLKGIRYRVFPVGRLDYDSEGLLLLTNDGDFAHAILHPSKKIPKSYLVKVKGIPDEEDLIKLREGIRLEDGVTAPAKLQKISSTQNNAWLHVTIHEGRKRQIRRMLEQIGHPALKLKRIRINGIELGNLKPGEYRYLKPEEVVRIKQELAGAQGIRRGARGILREETRGESVRRSANRKERGWTMQRSNKRDKADHSENSEDPWFAIKGAVK